MQAGDFDSDGVKIHYVVEGQGEPVILIHGLYASAVTNWQMPGIMGELAKHNQVVALDCRGHGQSGKPEEEGQYGVKMVEDVVRLMAHLHIAKARVAGYSMGGMITMKLLTLHPERVSSAVVGGMGWMKDGSALQRTWEGMKGRERMPVPVACLHGFVEFGVTEEAVKAIKVSVEVIVGETDPCRMLYVEPLRGIRPDWPVQVIPKVGHILCVVNPEFKAELKAALERPSHADSPSR